MIKKRFIKYCIFGSTISIVEILLFTLLHGVLRVNLFLSNAIAFLISVMLSYYANSKYVFKTVFISKKAKIRKFYIFLGTRFLGLFVDSTILSILIHISFPNMIAKTISCVSTTIVNYVIGKYIFK